MNKPVVVPEETLTEPVVVSDVTPAVAKAAGPAYIVLAGISFSHFLNDTMQSLIASVYPILKDTYALDFAQIGMITLAFQFTASLLQPVVGHYTDRKAQPYSLAIGMASTFFGLLLLSAAQQYLVILVAAALVGLGSAVFHPESARIARLASGGRYGFAQSVFQLGGSFGTSMGPVLAALIVVPFGQGSIAWFSSIAFLAILILWRIGRWYAPQIKAKKAAAVQAHPDAPSSRRVAVALLVLVALLFSKQLYVSSLSSYYIFYLIDRFGVSTQAAQIYLFIFLAANAVGAFLGGPLGDRFGRKIVIWISILGALPFTLALPYAGLYTSAVLSVAIGLIISSTTSSIIVFAQELVPHRFGMISGVFFGVAFGIGGLG
ncbi:MFS transporter, partial [Bradyrhizobium guangdongense]|uniref:MFS transporter n=1 Tax=Bradyrhizobium guangdongense TaxID=1325090 RepID=UPI003D9A6CB6